MKSVGEQLTSLTKRTGVRQPQTSVQIGQGDDSDIEKLSDSAYDKNGTIARLIGATSSIASDVATAVSTLAKAASGILQTVKNFTQSKELDRKTAYDKIADGGDTVVL